MAFGSPRCISKGLRALTVVLVGLLVRFHNDFAVAIEKMRQDRIACCLRDIPNTKIHG